MKTLQQPYVLKVILFLVVATPFILWLLPADFFDNQEIILCVSKYFLGRACPGCGLTRAVMHFHHFEFSTALQFNKLVIIAYPALIILWFMWIQKLKSSLSQ